MNDKPKDKPNSYTLDMISLDDDGYPTDQALEVISKWPDMKNIKPLLDKIKSIWAYNTIDFSWDVPDDATYFENKYKHKDDKKNYWMRAATVGWSGNESIIHAMNANFIFRMSHYMTVVGGLHIYKFNDWMLVPETVEAKENNGTSK